MTSRFVSGGTIAGQGGEDGDLTQTSTHTTAEGKLVSGDGYEKTNDSESVNKGVEWEIKNEEWEKVQRELEEERKKRADARRRDAEGGGEKSLFDVLQANKAAKQAAFEEANRIKNQFRSLDDDEIEFLDEVESKKRAEEEEKRREVEDGIRKFREKQKSDEQKDGVDGEGGEGIGDVEWASAGGRKRKREKEREKGLKGVKRRGSGGEKEKEDGEKGDVEEKPQQPEPAILETKPKPVLGLVDYGSDEDEDD
ncbi:N-terminal domain of NEFA-interacting nuclear protein NIP30-domain-containing protein [Xylariaceae sp. FL1019]|nr:N-terminal domain of NEFA-interacting nuclear protein NIP30-domain-containing protein [Xylariaceae sp. FL1019]